MSAQVQTQVKPTPMPMPSLTRAPSGLVQHKCACGGSHALSGECQPCRQSRLRVQRRALDTLEFLALPTHSTLGHDFGRVSVTNVRARPAGDEQEKRDEQEADRAAAQVEQGIAPALTTSSTSLAIRRRALEEEEETFGEDVVHPEVEATEPATPTAAEAMPEAASPATEPTPETGPVSEPEIAPSESAAEARGGGLIVEDEAGELMSVQMRKGAFLDELRAAACAVADSELAAVGRSTEGCPYIERWIEYYRTRDSGHVERAIRRYAPETVGVTSAREYIPPVSERIRQGVARWARTGEISGVPEELLSQAMGGGVLGAIGGAVSSVVGAVSSLVSGIGSLFFKERAGGVRDAERADPQHIQAQLGGGSPLDSSVRARMEPAFGHDFSRVRVHTDGQAANLSSSLNARAFTIGSDVAFGAGEYQPGTLMGDALLAHELAHVVQQGGASTATSMPKGESQYNSLEEDADVSAVGAVVSLWGGTKGSLAEIGKKAMPRWRSGLRLQRCGGAAAQQPSPPVSAPVTSAPPGTSTTPCPTTVRVGAIAQRNHSDLSAADKERFRTELGAMSRMDVGPGPDHTGHCMKEYLTTISNTCPATWSDGTPNRPCTGNRCLDINRYGTMWGLHDGPTTFFDMHRMRAPLSVLEGTGVDSCEIVCEQYYRCDRTEPTTGVFRITRNFQAGTHTKTDGTTVHITTGTVTKTER